MIRLYLTFGIITLVLVGVIGYNYSKLQQLEVVNKQLKVEVKSVKVTVEALNQYVKNIKTVRKYYKHKRNYIEKIKSNYVDFNSIFTK